MKCPDRITFEGTVDVAGSKHESVSPEVGGRRVIDEFIERLPGRWKVRAFLGIEPEPVAAGELDAYTGWGGSDVTPPDPPSIEVGGIELVDRLRDLDGRHVVLSVEPLARLDAHPKPIGPPLRAMHVTDPAATFGQMFYLHADGRREATGEWEWRMGGAPWPHPAELWK